MTGQQALIADPQPTLPFEEVLWEDPDYLSRQLITYIGNKRALLEPIRAALDDVCARLGKDRLQILDAFSGSGVVSRMFKRYAHHLVANDIEDYARVINTCYLANRSDFPETDIRQTVDRLNQEVSTQTIFPKASSSSCTHHETTAASRPASASSIRETTREDSTLIAC